MKPKLMSSSTPRDHNRSSVDMRPLTGGGHGGDKSQSSRNCRVGFVRQIGTDLLSTLICLTHCGGFVTRWVGKKWRCSNAVIPTLGLIRLYSSLTTLFPRWNSLTNHHSQTEPRMKGMRLVVNRETSKLIEFDLKAKCGEGYYSFNVDLAFKKT